MKQKIVLIVLFIICLDSYFSIAKIGPKFKTDFCLENDPFNSNQEINPFNNADVFIGPVLNCELESGLIYPATPPPDNDLCTGATELGIIGCSFNTYFAASPEATPDSEATGNCINSSTPGQWYTFTTPNPILFTTLLFNLGGANVEIFKTVSDCGALDYVDCSVGPFFFDIEPATTYYILSTNGFGLSTQPVSVTSCGSSATDLNFGSANPYNFGSFTDCSLPSSIVPCENDHVRWYEYTSGCNEAELFLKVSEYTGVNHPSAPQVSISVFLDDCATLASDYDVNGIGYVCNGMDGETITLQDIPPETTLYIAHGSESENIGHFNVYMLETADYGDVENDYCVFAEPVFEGINEGLSNLCASWLGGAAESGIIGCDGQYDATVWFEYDPGDELQDVFINVISTGIISPAIGVFESCSPADWGNNDCTGNINLLCIDYPILIEIGSSTVDAGSFDLEITTTPSGGVVESTITAEDICSHSAANILIDVPNGELVNIEVEVSPNSSPFISGVTGYNFLGVSSATINDILVNSLTVPQVVILIITVNPLANSCSIEPVELTFTVYPDFTSNNIMVDECLPHLLELDVADIVQGGSPPFASVSWYWNSTDLIGSANQLTYSLIESGEITVEILDSNGCEGSILINVEVSEPTSQTFDFPLEYCRSDQDNIYFPSTSLELINGSWSPPEFNLDNTADGQHEIIFTPEEASCNSLTILTIDISSGIVPVFDLPTLICSDADADEIVFPTLDQNGVVGYWDYPTFDPSSGAESFSNTFTPDTEDCASLFYYTFEVSSSLELTFNHPQSLCKNDDLLELNTASEEGYIGTWDIPIIDPSSISSDSINLVWTPIDGQSDCIDEVLFTIQFLIPATPEFTLPEELCPSDEMFTFPLADNQGLTGSWTIPSIEPSNATGTVQSTFTPSDNCTEAFTWEISIVEPLTPTFILETSYCTLDSAFTLPTVSDNGISGSWSFPSIDPMTVGGGEITLSFVGESTDTCVESIEIIFDIIEAMTPDFDLPDKVCWMDSDLSLPTNSLNGIEGSWEPSIIDVQANLGEMITSTFTPSEAYCAESSSHAVTIIAPYAIDISIIDPSGCMVEDGSILIDSGQIANLEYSIDGGTTWQDATGFSGLSSGGYMVLIRSTVLSDCILEREAFLNTADGPVLNELSSSDINSCISFDGSIIVDASGNDLEYSIDGGNTWQASNEFNDLPPGQYVISIKETMSDCIIDADAIIEDIIQTEVLMVNTQDISDCNADDGQIEIIATGEYLEYSIDNGATWSSQNLFDNLPSGDYEIIVQSTVGEDCIVESFAVLAAPNMPEIIEVMVQHPTVCDVGIGIIEVDAAGDNLEYSFDGGVTWQNAGLINGVSAGEYTVIVRDADRIQCFVEEDVTIVAEEESLIASEFLITLPTDCDLSDGILEVTNSELGLEYSIDAGANWQGASIFNDLPSGT